MLNRGRSPGDLSADPGGWVMVNRREPLAERRRGLAAPATRAAANSPLDDPREPVAAIASGRRDGRSRLRRAGAAPVERRAPRQG